MLSLPGRPFAFARRAIPSEILSRHRPIHTIYLDSPSILGEPDR